MQYSSVTDMLVQIIVHMSNAYMSALHESSYISDLACTRMHIHKWNEKYIVLSTCRMRI